MEKSPLNFKNLVLLSSGLYILYAIHSSFSDVWLPDIPDFDEENNSVSSVESFNFKINKNMLQDLKTKLELELEKMREDNELKRLTAYWIKQYEWKVREKLINSHPQYKTTISGLSVQFQRITANGVPKGNKTRPILMLHGEDGTFLEFQNIIPLLLKPEDSEINFELIVPSIPGFGYSQNDLLHSAKIMMKLMKRIGYEKFYIHGSQGLASEIASTIAAVYPHNVVGIHLSTCKTKHPLAFLRDIASSTFSAVTALDFGGFSRLRNFYSSNQYADENSNSTKLALCNSPTVLAANFLEKLGQPLDSMNLDTILDNIMIRWLRCSDPVKHDEEVQEDLKLDRVPLFVPTSCTVLKSSKDDFPPQPRYVIGDKFRQILHFSEIEHTGSFPSIVIPKAIAKEIVTSFNLLEKRGFAFFDQYHRCQLRPYD